MNVPSLDWFRALADRMHGEDAALHRHIGEIDLVCVFSFLDTPEGDQHYRLRFEEYDLVDSERLPTGADVAEGADFVLEGDGRDWQDMVDNIVTNALRSTEIFNPATNTWSAAGYSMRSSPWDSASLGSCSACGGSGTSWRGRSGRGCRV